MKRSPIKFGKRQLGLEQPAVVVAEIGVNHEGNIQDCLRLIEAAAKAGADAVKLQTIDPDENYVPGSESHALFQKARLSQEETCLAFAKARQLGMEIFTTAGDLATLAWVDELQPAAHKISSGLITHLPLIRAAAATGRPLILSTGMTGTEEIREAVEAARLGGCRDLCLLQCTSLYPAPISQVHLRAIRPMMEAFDAWVGFSDHTCDPEVPALAVAAGAVMIEKHFSLDPTRPGFDHAISVDSNGLSDLVRKVRKAEICLGEGNKACIPVQTQAAERYLRKIVARRDIDAGEPLDLSNVGFMRTPDGQEGLSPAAWEAVAGKHVARPMRRFQTIRRADLLDP